MNKMDKQHRYLEKIGRKILIRDLEIWRFASKSYLEDFLNPNDPFPNITKENLFNLGCKYRKARNRAIKGGINTKKYDQKMATALIKVAKHLDVNFTSLEQKNEAID